MRTLAALSWEPQIKGALYVAIAVVVLPGSAWLLLSTNVGSRLGFQLAMAGLLGWMTVMGTVWWVYGRGPVGPSPTWKTVEIVAGDPGSAGRNEVLAEYPKGGWASLELTDKEVADAQPVVDEELVGRGKPFQSASDYLVTGAAALGGERKGPLGLNFRPFNVFHNPHYILIQVQKAVKPPAVAGQPAPKAVVDPTSPPVAVVMVRDLGAVRRQPAMVAVSCGILFGLFVYALHNRDKEPAET